MSEEIKMRRLEIELRSFEDRMKMMEDFLFAKRYQQKKEGLNISEAIQAMRSGHKVGKWHRDDIYLILTPRCGDYVEYIQVHTINGINAPWLPNSSELLAEDYRIIEDAE